MASNLSTDDLIRLEYELRKAALTTDTQLLFGVYAEPALERSSGVLAAIGGGIRGAGSIN